MHVHVNNAYGIHLENENKMPIKNHDKYNTIIITQLTITKRSMWKSTNIAVGRRHIIQIIQKDSPLTF